VSADASFVVALVGAGPGDVDLLTLDAEGAVLAARELVADRALSPLVAALDVAAPVTWADDEPVDAALLAAVGRGPGVIRLYLGDPWAHPAGDVERDALRAAGVDAVVVPGVLADLAAVAAAGIPVQERTVAVTTTFTVDRPAGTSSAVAHPTIAVPADPAHTLVVRTTDLPRTIAALASGADPAVPAAAVPAAAVPTGGPSTDPMRTERAPLGELAAVAPAGAGVVVVGLVAALDLTVPAAAPVGAAPTGSRA
jgi:siroheme synthase